MKNKPKEEFPVLDALNKEYKRRQDKTVKALQGGWRNAKPDPEETLRQKKFNERLIK